MNGQHCNFDTRLNKNKENEKGLKNYNTWAWGPFVSTSLWEKS